MNAAKAPEQTCKPLKVILSSETREAWCACGHSARYPFCDGTHRTLEMTPVKFFPPQDGEFAICTCKRTKTPPYCDKQPT
ncbi:CDGSH iron-sulfur domain-containing protein [Lunatimonas salinarum]|uniref:CDGSH iron-sulfur domain-containing protein n=1 Tax=Lunatimonas salinarum TaxID=1774590 RepID=UPI003CC92061